VANQTLARVLSGAADANIRFDDLRRLLLSVGFVERIKGSHHIYARSGVEDILNLQPRGSLAKPYQVKQVPATITKCGLGGESE
jgi:hypothetical protein